jgi:glutathione S-transferase
VLLYSHPCSSNALKVRFLLAELGQEYELREVPIARPRPAWYTAVNPLSGIPALDDGGYVLAESNTILRYLATRAGADWIYPTDAAERARVNEFLDRWSITFRPALFTHERVALGITPAAGFDGAPRDPEGAERVAEDIAPTLALLDRLVHPAGSVLGRMTIADCAAAPALYRTHHSGLDLTPYPNVRGLRDALVARPAFEAAGPVI